MKKQASQSETGLLTKAELAVRLHVTVRGVETLTARRKIPVLRISRRCVRYDWAKVQAALLNYEITAIAFRPVTPQP